MCRGQIDCELKEISFSFFYCFSCFEFCLKKHGYYHACKGKPIPFKVDWCKFTEELHECYGSSPPPTAEKLKELSPKKPMVNSKNDICWKEICTVNCPSEMHKTVKRLQAVRNNLFHGEKGWGQGTGNINRDKELLCAGVDVLRELAKLANSELAGFWDDYKIVTENNLSPIN